MPTLSPKPCRIIKNWLQPGCNPLFGLFASGNPQLLQFALPATVVSNQGGFMRKVMFLVSVFNMATAFAAVAQDVPPNPLVATLAGLGATTCETGALTCVTLPVPRDHFANDQSETLDVTFAVSLATEPSKGLLIYVVGGPGGSGLAVADDYLTAFDSDLIAQMDFVFFDQRGIGPVHGFSCPNATKIYDVAEFSLNDPAAANAQALSFVTDCTAELSSTELLPFVDSNQAIRDIEDFRIAIGVPKIWVYGESYGTQFAQQYATAFPASVSGVILDGVVDLNLSVSGFYGSYTAASEKILTRVLDGCADIAACAADMGGDASAAYDALAAKLTAAPVSVDYHKGDGMIAPLNLDLGLLQYNAFNALYGPYGRGDFLRALTAANRGDLLPMTLLGYSNLAIDPETGDGIPDPSWYPASYYAINCADYTEAGVDGPARAAGIIVDAKAFAPNAPRLLDAFWVERLICAYWPQQGPAERPAQFAGGDYPTIILNGDADPITPIEQSYRIFDNLKNGYLIGMQGGPHVIWGRGLDCPDKIVAALLVDGTLPAFPEQTCRQDLIDGYIPLTLRHAADAADALTVVQALETELSLSIGLANWDGEDPMTIGCNHGGNLTVGLGENDATEYAFAACAWWPGLVIDGAGVDVANGEAGDGLTLDLTISGDHQGDVAYHHDSDADAWVISGTYDNAPIIGRHQD